MKTLLKTLFLLVSVSAFASQAPDPKAPKVPGEPTTAKVAPAARVFFLNLKNGQTVPTKFKVKFGLEGMTLRPAGELASGTGHHHLIIDGNAIPAGQVVPADPTHLHFGKAQTETELELKPGKHKLVLQFADGAHISYGPEVASVVDIVVK